MAPLPLWLSCCAVREGGPHGSGVVPVCGPSGAADADDDDVFFDCAETVAELALDSGGLQLGKAPAEDPGAGRADSCTELRGDCTDLAAARAVLKRARELFCQHVGELARCGPELEWADLSAAKRMLQANNVDAQKAVAMFVQALELRARYRELFRTMHCQTCCDIRILARDVQERPVIYMCARSLDVPIGAIREQFMVTFEAACRMTAKEGRVTFVVDMQGLRPHLCMDLTAVRDLADTLGTVFAERIHRIMIVDFSRAAQAAWWMLKPMLTQKTRDKFAFVSSAKARVLAREMLRECDHQKLCSTLDINRDPRSTAQERALQARRTAMCSVPLGPPPAC